MLLVFVIISVSLFNFYLDEYKYYKYKILEDEVKEYRKMKRKLNKWRSSQDKIIEILDNGIYRLKLLRLNKMIKK
jgi:cell fate (sporulation/competence/biofilm development) regulator YlbF (YheA/YmcA/DUF963 family)